MKISKIIIGITILGFTSLSASGLNHINILLDEINKSQDLKMKNKLILELDIVLSSIDVKDLLKAQTIINTKLKEEKASIN